MVSSTANLHECTLRLSLLYPPPHASVRLGTNIGGETFALNVAEFMLSWEELGLS